MKLDRGRFKIRSGFFQEHIWVKMQTGFRLNWSPVKEPLGFVKIVEWVSKEQRDKPQICFAYLIVGFYRQKGKGLIKTR